MEEEVEVVNSIFEGCVEEWSENVYEVSIPETNVNVRLRFPTDYPESPPKLVTVKGASDPKLVQEELERLIDSTFVQGDAYIYSFVDEAMTLLQQMPAPEPVETDAPAPQSKGSQFKDKWVTGEQLVDRKSVFIGRAIKIESVSQVAELMDDLLQDNKISKATHNMMAYRVVSVPGVMESISQDFDDDGESAAGSRMLHLLQISNAMNVLVVVSRWYGGIHLGPDRFKDINSCAREVLVKGGFIN